MSVSPDPVPIKTRFPGRPQTHSFPVVFILSLLVMGSGAAMLVPFLMEMGEADGNVLMFAVPMFGSLAVGGLVFGASRSTFELVLDHRQAFLITGASWFIMPLVSAIPFSFHGMSWTDAVFEAASGLTTTGSTVIGDLDALHPSLLLWRSLLQWIGGVGIIVIAVALLPFMRVGGMQLLSTESSDPSGKFEARAHVFVLRILTIYAAMTLLCAFVYSSLGMSGFDAINHALTTLSTGGYSTHDASFGHFEQTGLHLAAIVFMIAGAIPFVAYLKFIDGDRTIFLRDPQVRSLLIILLFASVSLAVWHASTSAAGFGEALLASAFNTVSVVTTTGYASTDYTAWGGAAITVFFALTFLGGCAGSTSGGIKAYRLLVLYQVIRRYLMRTVMPSRVVSRTFDGRRMEEDAWIGVLVMVVVFFVTFIMFAIALSLTGLDFVTALSGSATAITNVGPGLGEIIGPAGNFASLPDAAKWLLSLEMILGRLEVLTFLVLLLPSFWD
jgi:trk/ktr system potassium uptake protein